MNPMQKLRWVEFPLALPTIITGVRTAAVMSVGTATLAAFIGAGGLGEFIVTGLALNNTTLILQGAIPAALLALITEFLFTGLEKMIVPSFIRNQEITRRKENR
jgi:osmoprotectant transport system permease protein